MTSKQELDKELRKSIKEFRGSSFGSMNEIEENITKYLTDCIKTQGSLSYMISVERFSKNTIDMFFPQGREATKATLTLIEKIKNDIKSVIITSTGFSLKTTNFEDTCKNYEVGSFEKRWKSGDKNIEHIATATIFLRDGEKFQNKGIYFTIDENNDLKNRVEIKDFDRRGYLQINL